MKHSLLALRKPLLLLVLSLVLAVKATSTPLVTGTLNAILDMGSLSGVTFPVSFSYDAGLVDSFGYGP